MNKFRDNLHQAFFFPGMNWVDESFENHQENVDNGIPEWYEATEDEARTGQFSEQAVAEEAADEVDNTTQKTQKELENAQKDVTGSSINNEALTSKSSVESKEGKEQSDEEVSKQLEKELNQLAKNKKINFPWTDNARKCSVAEKRLGVSSAKVFMQILDTGKITDMINRCKSHTWELTSQDAAKWRLELGINSKTKDIQNFYKSFQEYQNPQSEYQHLKNLMWFFCESNFEKIEDVKSTMETRSVKISKADINKWKRMLYQEWRETDEKWNRRYVIIDNKTRQKIDRKPKDWEKRASFEVIKLRLNDGNDAPSEDKMLTLLGDFNLDGEVNSGDVWFKTWTQFADVFRRTVATNALENKDFNADLAVQNLVAYANKFWLNIPEDVRSVNHLYRWMTNFEQWYENTTKLQNFIRNLPIELWDVLTNWADAWQDSLKHISSVLEIQEQEREAAEKAATEKAKEFVNEYDSLLKDRIKDATQRANITQQLLSQLPGVLMKEAKDMKQWLSVWASVPLDEIVKWLSLWFKAWIDKDWKPRVGIYWAWDHDFQLWHWFDVSTWVSAGLNSFFIPCESVFVELGYDVSEEKRNETLDAMWINRIDLWANCTMYGSIFSWWVSAWFEHNKQGGIEKQAKNINSQIKTKALDLIDAIKNKSEWQTDVDALKWKLKELFPKSSEEELNKAVNSIQQIISQIKIDENTTDGDKNIYVQIIADVYSEMWRNDAISWIADNKRKLSWWKVWIQFLAWFVPTVALVTRITKNYNARTNETEYSKAARIDAQVNGTGNKLIKLEWKEIWEDKVSQINEILKRYGARRWLSYFQWENGKPWRILVPEWVSDWVWINVRISKNLEWSVNEGWDWSYSFPANATYRLLQETRWNQRSLTLNIWSDRNSESDVIISDEEWMKWLLWEKELMWATKLEYSGSYENKWKIEYKPDFMDSLFTADVVEWLKTIDSSDRKKFSEFMKTKVDSERTFVDIIATLKEILAKDKKYESIVFALGDPSVSHEDKQLIADRIMAISADANVHQKWWLEAVVNWNTDVTWRWDYYKKETMVWPNGQPIFSEINVDRDALVKKIHESNNYNAELQTNLLWATAFYHKNNTAKGLAMIWLWVTTVLWWQKAELEWTDRFNTEKWFLWGWEPYTPWVLEKSPVEMSNMEKVISQKIWVNKISSEQLRNLLKWKEVELTLDNSQKKVIVKMDVKYVFYLMWECANESVGMELWDLQVQEQHEVEDYRQWELYLNDVEWSNSVSVARKDIAVGISFGGKKKEENLVNNTPVASDRADDWGKQFSTDDGDNPDATTLTTTDELDEKISWWDEV